jgi:hypothetical protein
VNNDLLLHLFGTPLGNQVLNFCILKFHQAFQVHQSKYAGQQLELQISLQSKMKNDSFTILLLNHEQEVDFIILLIQTSTFLKKNSKKQQIPPYFAIFKFQSP